MGDKYITPETEIMNVTTFQVLCQSGVQSGEIEDVGRMEFDWQNMMNLKYIFIAALVVLASCQVEEHEEKNDANVDVTFVARNEAKVKTALNEDDKVLWDEEDQIAILWDGGSVMSEARLGTDRSVAEFTAKVPAGKDYYAVYPYSGSGTHIS